MSGYTIIDVDTHVTETPDVWTGRVPDTMKDRVPRIDLDAKGRQWWFLGDRRIANPGLTATAGVGDMTKWPTSYDEMHPGAFDATERLAYMDAMRIRAMAMFPNEWRGRSAGRCGALSEGRPALGAAAASAGDEPQCGRVRQARTARIHCQRRALPVTFRSSADSPPRLWQRGRPWWESACLQSSAAPRSSDRSSPRKSGGTLA